MSSEKYTAAQMIQAIQESNGILAMAARKLQCSRTTVYRYIQNYPTVKDAYDEANETNIDFVEGKLMENIRNGNVTAQIFFLKTKAKHRGYVERQEFTGKEGGPLAWKKFIETDKDDITGTDSG